jgi:hypothetical protein
MASNSTINGAAILNGTWFDGDVLPADVRHLVTGALGCFLLCVGLLELRK